MSELLTAFNFPNTVLYYFPVYVVFVWILYLFMAFGLAWIQFIKDEEPEHGWMNLLFVRSLRLPLFLVGILMRKVPDRKDHLTQELYEFKYLFSLKWPSEKPKNKKIELKPHINAIMELFYLPMLYWFILFVIAFVFNSDVAMTVFLSVLGFIAFTFIARAVYRHRHPKPSHDII